MKIDMKYSSLSAVLISIVILFSLLSCMKRPPVRIGDVSRIAYADVTRINVPADIEVESVDGHRVKSLADYILSTIEEIHVAPGEHEIVVRYSTFWEYDKRRREEIKSKKIALKFNAERGGLYMLTHPELDDMREAKKFAENPDIWIAKVGKFSDKENEGTRASRSVEMSESRRYTEPEKPPIIERDTSLMIPEKKNEISKSAHKTQVEKSSTMKEDTALKEEWYSLSEEEKEEFRKWLEWNNMSEEEKEKFREWTNKSDKE